MPCLVQGDVEDLTEVNRVGCPELIGTAQFSDRDTVFQGDACERIVRRDLRKGGKKIRSAWSGNVHFFFFSNK